jgi:hypothetical protein
LLLATATHAHPVPRKTHDHTVTVHITSDAIVVNYHLEIDEWTVVYVDIPSVMEKPDLAKLKKPADFYEAFTRSYGPIVAKNLSAQLDDKDLEFRCAASGHNVADHVQCDFRLEATCKLQPGKQHTLKVRDDNFDQETGMLRLSITNTPDVPILRKTEPDEALKSRPSTELKPGDDDKLRKATATFEVESPTERPVSRTIPAAAAKSSPQ